MRAGDFLFLCACLLLLFIVVAAISVSMRPPDDVGAELVDYETSPFDPYGQWSNPAPLPMPSPTNPPVESEGRNESLVLQLSVTGNRIYDSNGDAVLLRGVDNSITSWYDNGVGYDSAQYTYMRDWGCNAMRITISDWDFGYTSGSLGCYESGGFWTRLDSLVDGALAKGIYPIICGWATMGNSPDGYYSGYVSNFIPKYHSWADFTNVYALLAQRYAGKNVIYELWNEPLSCPLATYKTYMEAAVDAIRTYDANAVVVVQAVGTGDWDTLNLQFVQTHNINRTNIVYCFHQYASYNGALRDSSVAGVTYYIGSNGAYTSYADWVIANGYPVISTEFGASGVGCISLNSQITNWLNNFMTVMDTNGYSGYTAWRWITSAYECGNPMLANWNGTPTSYGLVIRDYYQGHYPPELPEPPIPPPPQETYTVNVSAGLHGSVWPSGEQTKVVGQSLTAVATPDINYGMDAWTLDGTQVSTNYQYIFNNGVADGYYELAASFTSSPPETQYFTVVITSSTGGSCSPTGTQQSAVGTPLSVTATATPGGGYTFSYWTLDGTAYSTSNPVSVSGVVDESLALHAVFEVVPSPPTPPTDTTYRVYVTRTNGGTLNLDGSYTVDADLDTEVYVTSIDDNYRFVYWELNGASVGVGSSYSLDGVAGGVYTLRAVFQYVPPPPPDVLIPPGSVVVGIVGSSGLFGKISAAQEKVKSVDLAAIFKKLKKLKL